MTRVVLLIFGLGAAMVAAYVLLSGAEIQSIFADSKPGKSVPYEDPGHDHIDEQSRERLREILRDADSGSDR